MGEVPELLAVYKRLESRRCPGWRERDVQHMGSKMGSSAVELSGLIQRAMQTEKSRGPRAKAKCTVMGEL